MKNTSKAQTKTASASETRKEYYTTISNQPKYDPMIDERIEDARTEARLDAIYDREEREGALYR